jgi:uncharacterized SAM-binding protein YcdF (DUF218 family)
MMYWIKQTVGALTAPVSIALLIGLLAGICRLAGRRRLSVWLWSGAAGIAYLSALDPVGDALLGPLERVYAPLRDERLTSAVKYVVVLGSSYDPRYGIPVTGALDADGLARIVEGVRLVAMTNGAFLVVSGGAPGQKPRPAEGYKRLARSLGVDPARIVVLDQALDTGDEARAVAARIGPAPFVLVTSAYHMPRAMRLMARAGTRAIPAPTGQQTGISPGFGWHDLLPGSQGLGKTERALHEYIGLVALGAGIT